MSGVLKSEHYDGVDDTAAECETRLDNDTSHKYNREKALKILAMMKNLLEDTEFLYNELEKELKK